VLIPLGILAIGLVQHGVIALIKATNENVFTVYGFDIVFMLAGTVVMTVYLAVIAGIINFAAALLRKFGLYAFAFFGVLVAVTITNFSSVSNALAKAAGFLTAESSVWLFLLKGIVIFAVLFLASMIINRYTVYYKSNTRSKTTTTVIIGILIAIIAAIVVSGLLIRGAVSTDENNSHSFVVVVDEDRVIGGGIRFDTSEPTDWPTRGRIEIDISHLDSGSSINAIYADGRDMYFGVCESLVNIQGDTIVIDYQLPHNVIDGVNLNYFANPEVTARLDGNNLYLEYNIKSSVRVIIAPMFGFMRQFDYFTGRDLVREETFGTYSSSTGSVWAAVVDSLQNSLDYNIGPKTLYS
jgi:hypothetical protein